MGEEFGRLVVMGPAPSGRAGLARWTCRCSCGATVVVVGADLRKGRTNSCGCLQREVAGSLPGPDNPNWRGDGVTYSGLHQRVRRVRGAARGYQCVGCDQQARQWAYGHHCPDERNDGGLYYCTHPEHYEPRCVPCHRLLDRARAAGQPMFPTTEGVVLPLERQA